MIYIIVYGPLQAYFSGMDERGVRFVYEKNHALAWSSKEEALNMEGRLNQMFNQQMLEFSVMEKDPAPPTKPVACYWCGKLEGQTHDAYCGAPIVSNPSNSTVIKEY